MAKAQPAEEEAPAPKPLVWLHGEIKTPPFTAEGRQEAGLLLRLLQQGEHLTMPQAEPLPDVGKRCGALRCVTRSTIGELCTASTPMPL